MRRQAVLAVAIATLAMVGACGKGEQTTAAPGTPSPSVSVSSAPPTPQGSTTAEVCGAYDTAFAGLISDKALAAVDELKANYKKPAEALSKLRSVTEAYVAQVEKAKQQAPDPALKAALDEELIAGKMMIGQLDPSFDGQKIHVAWTKYYLRAGTSLGSLCPASTLPTFHTLDAFRAKYGG